jgi:curved DNA-binding protein CbpA
LAINSQTSAIDYFALLNQPRRPWLEPESLKKKFHVLSADLHPDRVHTGTESEKKLAQQRFSELNAAYNCLRDPRQRLQHLLELELGQKPQQVQNIPPDLMQMFMEVGQLCRDTDTFLTEKAAATSPLLQVRVFEHGQSWTEKLMALQQQIAGRHETVLGEVRTLDGAWDGGLDHAAERSGMLKRLEELYRLLAFLGRWTSQIQERIVKLAL